MDETSLSREDIEVIGKIIKSGILKYDINSLVDILKRIQEECCIQESDDETTRIFKMFIVYGQVKHVASRLKIKYEKVSDVLFFKKCENDFLTLIAKYLYSISGTEFQEFLKIQVEVAFQTGMLDVKQEYIKWRMKIYKDEINKGIYTKQEILNEVEKIEFD